MLVGHRLILDDDGFTLPFDMERTNKCHGELLPSTPAGNKVTPMVRWPMPPRIRGEPPKDFEGDMREFMEGERYSPCAGNPMERPREREDTSDTLLAKRPIERPQFVTPIVREEQGRTVHPDLGYKAAGGGRVVRWSWVNFQCRGVLLVWMIVRQGPIVLAVGAGGGCLDSFTLIYPFSPLSPSLWETTRFRLKYCLKGSLSQKTTNQQQPI